MLQVARNLYPAPRMFIKGKGVCQIENKFDIPFSLFYSAATVTVTTQVDSVVMSGFTGCEATKR